MPQYQHVGEVPRKRHTQFPNPDGGLYYEEGIGIEGFGSDWALLYHRHHPSAISDAVLIEREPDVLSDNLPLKPRHFKTGELKVHGDPISGRQLLMGNEDVRLSHVAATEDSGFFRNAIGDELLYVHGGTATLQTPFGELPVGPGDYVIIPTSTIQRWLVHDGPFVALVVEAAGHIGPPARYLTTRGQFTEQSPYCERDIRTPDGPLVLEGTDVQVLVKNRAGLTRFTYPQHPFDVIGWDGCLYPYALSITDFEPLTGRVHQPPPLHQVFEGPNFVMCNFVPRKLDYHPLSIPTPYNHSNVDSDEVLFYVGGDYTSRKGSGIGVGSISLHPSGCSHGPAPGAMEASIGKQETDEVAVMVDTFRPLQLGSAAHDCEDDQYAWSWARKAAP